MTDKVNHLQQMVTGLLELWQDSAANQVIIEFMAFHEHVGCQELGVTQIPDADKVGCLT